MKDRIPACAGMSGKRRRASRHGRACLSHPRLWPRTPKMKDWIPLARE
jgi:hypothetical protein